MLQGLPGFAEICLGKGNAGDENDVRRLQGGEERARRFPQQAFSPVALYGSANIVAGRHSDAGVVQLGRADDQYNKRVRVGLSLIPHPFEFDRPGQAEPALHTCLATKRKRRPGSWNRFREGRLPPDFLDVVVGRDRQPVAALGAAAPEYFAPFGGCHPRAETVHADTAANLGLVGSFWHCKILTLYEKDNNK